MTLFTLYASETKIAEFANSLDPDKVAQSQPPPLYLHYLPLIFEYLIHSLEETCFKILQSEILSSDFLHLKG